MSAADTAAIKEIFRSHMQFAEQLTGNASNMVSSAFGAFANSGAYNYVPYQWNSVSPPVTGYNPPVHTPIKPALRVPPMKPVIKAYPTIPPLNAGVPPANNTRAPVLTFPSTPGGPPTDTTGTVPKVSTPHFPNQPNMLPLPPATLPYLTLNIPDAPTWTDPVFMACPPSSISTISLDEYLQKLADAFAEYSDTIPRLVMAHWLEWYRAMLNEQPLIDKIEQILTTYYDKGGAGIPVPIEEAIVTRATDRVTVEYRRSMANVFDGAVRRGLLLPSGALLAGHKEARQVAAEATSKVITDTAIKNLELEHDYMKFMLQLGLDFEKMLLGFAGDLAKTVTEANGQAIEMTKQILSGMISVNDAIIKIYMAQWEGYKAAVEVYKAQWQAVEIQIRVYEAEIKAELAKVEINKAYVDMLTAMVGANNAIVNLYKATIDAETAKLEADRVAILGYQASVQAYVAKIEAYKAQWQGYAAANEGQLARAKAYEAEVQGYTASVNAYKALVEAKGEEVKAISLHVEAVGKENEQVLKAWQIELEGNVHAYVAEVEAFKTEWSAEAEKMKGYAEATRILGNMAMQGYVQQTHIDIERAHQHLAEWRGSLEAIINAAKGATEAAGVASHVASSALNGVTSFAGVLAASEE